MQAIAPGPGYSTCLACDVNAVSSDDHVTCLCKTTSEPIAFSP
jgi:hypothetical protein